MFHDMGNFDMGFGWIFMFIFWLLIILGIVAIVKWLSSSAAGVNGPAAKTALDILQERYARGEIDQQEFQQKRHELEQ